MDLSQLYKGFLKFHKLSIEQQNYFLVNDYFLVLYKYIRKLNTK